MKKGSITVFFALVLSIIIVLICASIESVKMMCARTQIANSADVGMYSLFAQYDSYLLERYGLFYVDASYGTDALQIGKAYQTVEEYMDPILRQNYLDLSIVSGGITGFALAADCNGQPFRNQAVEYMRDMPGSQGAQFLADAILENGRELQKAQEVKEQVEAWQLMSYYDEEMAWAGNESAQAEANLPLEEMPQEPKIPVENPIDAIREIQKMDILDLVISHPENLSDREIDVGRLVSHRDLEQGMGTLYPAPLESSEADQALFQEYLMQNCSTYADPVEGRSLKYQVEYIIEKSPGDEENLKKMANRLLRIREGINFAFLYGDSEKRAQSAALAADIASDFFVPPATGIIEEALLSCWAFGESVMEVKALFDGGCAPLLKTAQNWKLPLENLSGLMNELSVEQPASDEREMDYADYLRALLFLETEDSKTMGGMDVIEADIRSQPGRENFRMDCCLESMEVEVDVQVNQRKTYTALHRYGYNR